MVNKYSSNTENKILDAAKKVADIMTVEYQWDKKKREIEIQEYLEYIEKTISFI